MVKHNYPEDKKLIIKGDTVTTYQLSVGTKTSQNLIKNSQNATGKLKTT